MDHASPATEADISEVKANISEVKANTVQLMLLLQKMHDDLYKADDQILGVLTNVDQRLTKTVEDHERRIVALERQAA